MSRTYTRWNAETATAKLIELCNADGLEFVGFIGEFVGTYSEFNYICPIHGIHKATFKNFVNHGSRCPNCHGGYNTDFAGTFYIFKIEAEGKQPIFKFGITNRNADIRGNEHIRGIENAKSTKVCDMFFANGTIPLKIEKHVKKHFSDNSGVWLKTGYTETVAANDEVLNDIITSALKIAA